jgi:hypothetical protein
MWTKFHVKTRNFDFIEKMGPYRKIIVKSRYLRQIAAWADIILGFF